MAVLENPLMIKGLPAKPCLYLSLESVPKKAATCEFNPLKIASLSLG